MSETKKTTPGLPSPRAAAYPGHWKGRFIWDRGESLPHNSYMMCRKTLHMEDAPEAAQIHITAAIKYTLWVNGKYVGSGPARSFPEWKSYDTHGLSGVLEAGKNVISVLCWFTGIPNNYSADERAGLWAQIEYIGGSGQLHETGTDESWRLRQAQGIRRDVSHFRGIMAEIHDSRLDPQDWLDVDFDDSQWENATCLISGEYRASPQMMASWTYMEPRQTPLMRERDVEPREVAFVGEADASFYPDIANIVERASGQELFPLQYAKAEGADTLAGARGGRALFQNNRPTIENTPTDNLLANRKCYVFAPPEDAGPRLPEETFQDIPESMVFGTKVCKKQEGFIGSDGEIDLASFIGGVCEYRPADIYVPFSIEEEREFIIGAGADWWMECHVDGEKIFDTMHYGNGFHPPHYSNFRKKVTFQRGTHLLAARICSGALGSVFSCGIIPASPPETTVRDPFITLDFGRIHNAFPCIEFDAPPGAVIEICCGGEMSPDGRASWGVDPNWSRPASFIAAGGRQRWQVFEPVPVRFLQVTFRNVEKPITVFGIKLISWEYPAKRRGSFACSDEILTKLWTAGVDTSYLHMDDTVIFDVVRERAAWVCNSEVEHGNLAIAAGYGDLPFSRWHLKQSLRSQLPSGLFQSCMGSHAGTNAGFSHSGIPERASNCLYAVNHKSFIAQNVYNWYWNFGDIELLEEWYPALARLAEWNMRMADDNGLLYNLPGPVWFEWISDQELKGAHFGSNVVYSMLLKNLGEIAGRLNYPGDAEKWKNRAVAIRDTLRRMHWNEEHSLFCDSVVDGKQAEIFTEVGNGMALYYDIADDFQRERIVKKLTQDENGCTKATTLYFYYFIEGLIRAGAVDYALKRLRRDNKYMMELTDPPTLWEQWPDVPSTHRAGNSPLHFGGAGVVWTLSSHVLGVQAAAPAFSACRIQPKCGRLSWARGVVPSVRGDIRVEWRKSADVFAMSVVLPDAMPTEIFLPFKVRETSVLNHNGTRYARQGSKGRGQGISWSAEGLTVGVNGGNHTLEISG